MDKRRDEMIKKRKTCIDCYEYNADNFRDETLSTSLPDVNDCVEIDTDMLKDIVANEVYLECENIYGSKSISNFTANLIKALANSKSILKWRKVDNG